MYFPFVILSETFTTEAQLNFLVCVISAAAHGGTQKMECVEMHRNALLPFPNHFIQLFLGDPFPSQTSGSGLYFCEVFFVKYVGRRVVNMHTGGLALMSVISQTSAK